MDWYLKVLKNYIGFGGRARRKEYWMFILVNLILTGVLSIIDKMLGWQRAGGEGILTTIYAYWSFYRGGRCNFAVCMTPIVRPGGYCCC
ncbi:inner membrane protein YhaH [Klebsiella pneumoniae]|nr:inner membrane protein YhaH [Klebsiella pneumoniae]